MIEINLESMADVEAKRIGNNILLRLINCTGEEVTIITTASRAEWIQEAIENACGNKRDIAI